MATVLLIQPNYDIDCAERWKSEAWMNLALPSLATYIKEKGNHKVKILDRNLHYDNEKFIRFLKEFNPDIVGMTCYTAPVIKDVMQLSKITKENSKAMVLVGGIHATLEPKSLLEFKYIDYVVRGEGEETLLDICGLIDKKKATRTNMLKLKNVNYNELRPFLDLDKLPMPDYDMIEVPKYMVTTFCTSRGCPGKCRFCYNQGRQLRFYNAQKTMEMMTKVIKKYKIREFTIADDNFANMSKRTTDICNALSKLNCVFFCFLRADMAQDKVLSELKRAGCSKIQFGFESGSQKMLDFMNKMTKVEQNEFAIKQCKKFGIAVEGSFMLGMPTETLEDAIQTRNFIRRTGLGIAFTKIYKPFPSTEFYDICVKNKLMTAPKNLQDWIDFCDINESGINLNVSQIPDAALSRLIHECNFHRGSEYLNTLLFLVKRGNYSYAFLRIRQVINNKLKRLLKQGTN